MILSCNSCEKKFVVPDSAIGAAGRLVQCSACGNKWKQFPDNEITKVKEKSTEVKLIQKKTQKTSKVKRPKAKKRTGPNLYSPEYLAKKHGIKINESSSNQSKVNTIKSKVGFGFYNSLMIFVIFLIFFFRMLYFTQEIIIEQVSFLEIYINYLFETLKNIQEITINIFSNY